MVGLGLLVPCGWVGQEDYCWPVAWSGYHVCNLWAQTRICVQPCRVLSSTDNGHVQDAIPLAWFKGEKTWQDPSRPMMDMRLWSDIKSAMSYMTQSLRLVVTAA